MNGGRAHGFGTGIEPFTCVAVTLMSGAISLVEGWRPFTVRDVALLALAAAFLSGGYYFIISSMRLGEISLIAPFRYTGLLFALVLGYFIWDEVPNALAWGGTGRRLRQQIARKLFDREAVERHIVVEGRDGDDGRYCVTCGRSAAASGHIAYLGSPRLAVGQ